MAVVPLIWSTLPLLKSEIIPSLYYVKCNIGSNWIAVKLLYSVVPLPQPSLLKPRPKVIVYSKSHWLPSSHCSGFINISFQKWFLVQRSIWISLVVLERGSLVAFILYITLAFTTINNTHRSNVDDNDEINTCALLHRVSICWHLLWLITHRLQLHLLPYTKQTVIQNPDIVFSCFINISGCSDYS